MQEYNAGLDEVQEVTEDRGVPCEDIGGVAGSGKTYSIVQAVKEDVHYGVLCSTTGISAVNLGATTLHSLLRFFDTASARDWYLSGGLVRVLHVLAREYRRLIIDEKSMLDGALLDILYRGVREANQYADVITPMGITLVGDWCQLPPVRARWAFEAACWPEFAWASRVLTTQWRQSDPAFVTALNAVRRGDGALGAELLTAAGTQWHTQLDPDFAGTTILPVNRQVERYNALALDKVPGRAMKIASRRWGRQRPEWGESRSTHEWGIPQALEIKLGAYVMLLANKPDGDGGFEFVNGDCGTVVDVALDAIEVMLVRTSGVVTVSRIVRAVDTHEKPEGWDGKVIPAAEDDGAYVPEPHYRGKSRRYVAGQVEFMPVRLAYASSVHKSQSLTLDRVQVDIRHNFFGSPAMAYVALSRCRTREGLRIVGQREVFVKRCAVDEKVRPYL